MVGHYHQDFLSAYDGSLEPAEGETCYTEAVVAGIRDYGIEKDLFDFYGPYMRKARLTELDEYIDEQADFDAFVAKTRDLDRLVLIDDRKISHPFMAEYDLLTKARYCAALREAGVKLEIATIAD